MSPAQYEIVDAADGTAKLRLTGDWTTTALGRLPRELGRDLDGRDIVGIDTTDLGRFDTAGALAVLTAAGCRVDAWETTYLHVLDATADPDPVFTWVSGTGARPTLQALPDTLRPVFEAEFRARLREAYPPEPAGVVLPFRRVFVVARIAGGRTGERTVNDR